MGGNWFSAMSGGLSLPLAIAAFYYPTESVRPYAALLATLCFFAAAFKAWETEHNRAVNAEMRFDAIEADRPRLELLYEDGDARFVQDKSNSLYSDLERNPIILYRLHIHKI
jgi:hypothetical protein